MKEQFKALAEQAGIQFCPVIPSSYPADVLCADQVLEKFAELIVQECAKLAVEYGCDRFTDTQIREHFGVD